MAAEHHHEEENPQKEVVRIAAAGIFFAAGVILERVSALPRAANVAAFFAAFMLCGRKIVLQAVRKLFSGEPFDETALMSVASLAAIALGELSEGVAVMWLYCLGEFLQDSAVDKSRDSIESLLDLRPDVAVVLRGGQEFAVAPDEVKIGDTIVVRAGEKIPLDGEVVFGECFVDERAVFGESVPQKKAAGDFVFSGAIASDGILKIRVEKEFSESVVAKILALVEESAEKKSKKEKFIAKFARIYTPIVAAVALLVAVAPPLLGAGEWRVWAHKALNFLIISCPCALVISVPLAFFAGVGAAARHGILLKGGNIFEPLRDFRCAVFDKTGTLTQGNFRVVKVVCAEGVDEKTLANAAFLAEKNSRHPAAKAVCQKCRELGAELPGDAKVHEIAGQGICALFDGDEILAGNEKLMENVKNFSLQTDSKTCVYLAKNCEFLGAFLVADSIRPDAISALSSLRKSGVSKIFMLTGDSKGIAAEVADELRLDGFFARLLPHEKAREFEKIASEHGSCAFVGDGINDAPALALADVGIAMGAMGSDAAIASADVVIMNDDLSKIALAKKTAKAALLRVKQNVAFALGAKMLVAASSLFFAVPIWAAIFADVGVALLCVANSMRQK